jgi:hypothetical protein
MSMSRKDRIVLALKSYKMWTVHDDDGNGYSLVDQLSSGPTVKDGLEEILRLAEHIDESLDDSLLPAGYVMSPEEVRGLRHSALEED